MVATVILGCFLDVKMESEFCGVSVGKNAFKQVGAELRRIIETFFSKNIKFIIALIF